MNISYNWLKDLIDIDLAPGDLGQKLTNVGLAVEGIHAHGDDLVLDIDLTSNRPDCLSHLGVARELAVITGSPVNGPKSEVEDRPPGQNEDLVTIRQPELCNRFTARIIRGVKIGASPEWLVDRLEAIGERSINNVADITNYVMHELGQPMHSFDLDKLAGGRIVVRRANPGEKITTLDEVDREMDTTMVAVCDAEKPVAVGGVMGGLASSITDETVNVLLEVAYFHRANIRATSRALGLATEASYRFERGVDIENLVAASDRATSLICELAGGVAEPLVDVYPKRFVANEIASNDISYAVKRLTGLEVETAECVRILGALGISVKPQSEISNLKSQITDVVTTTDTSQTFISPSWRHDLYIEEDLVEEVARHAGYENIGNELPPAFGAGEYQQDETREKALRQTLIDLGFDEALSYSFIDTRSDDLYEVLPGVLDEKAAERFVTLQDSVIEGAVRMRPSILPGLLDAVRLNLNHKRRDIKLFEVGKVFAAKISEDNLPNEQESLALVITGNEIYEGRGLADRTLDFYDAKGAVEAALSAAGVENIDYRTDVVKHLRQGQTAAVTIGGETIGYLGRLSDEIASVFKFRQPVYVAEINLRTALEKPVSQITYRPLAKYPGIVRDVSFVAGRTVTFAAIADAIREQHFGLCRNVVFVDIYEGKGVGVDERSITIRLEYRSDERTLIEDEVEDAHKQIIEGVEKRLGVRPRL